MKRLMISAFAAVVMLAAPNMLRPPTPSADRPAGSAGMMSLQGFQISSDVSNLPIEDFENQSLVYSKTRDRPPCHWLAICTGVEWKIPAPETCDAIRNAAMTAGTLMNLKN